MDLILPFDALRLIGSDFPLLPPITPFTNAPRLKRVSLSSQYDFYTMILPWSQLTSISIVGMYTYECADLLRYAVQLVDLTGATIEEEDFFRDPEPTLTAPALRHLTISGPMDELSEATDLGFVTSFISRLKCTLVSLQVVDATYPEAHYRAAFPSIPSITLLSTCLST
ncbi:hypothetical protein C8J57DRAFT_1513493 [Mycena rebaudengoi]|nr:hypothetical protein C8J57DRAFT_1513493 [Mycena rebaudengoi]